MSYNPYSINKMTRETSHVHGGLYMSRGAQDKQALFGFLKSNSCISEMRHSACIELDVNYTIHLDEEE